jgi:putative transposase
VLGRSGEAFEKCLFDVVERCGWRLFAYVIMSNHYHLAIETPEANLVAGMKWLQSTFATRFNRFRGERGHVFQGRYKAILLEENRPLSGLIDYIHLNPVRAGLCDVKGLKNYRLSSYAKYWKRRPPAGMDRNAVLSLHSLPDSLAGMRKYAQLLEMREERDPDARAKLYRKYCCGWFLGSAGARKELAKELAKRDREAQWEGKAFREIAGAQWEEIVREEIDRLGKTEEMVRLDRKGADWKVKIARRLRRETTASNPWIAQRLHMGHPSRVSNLINEKTFKFYV